MKSRDPKKILEPYRQAIDDLDARILELLARRYAVIRDVGQVKAQENIPAIIPERVQEVRRNAARLAEDYGLDPEFIEDLYARLIDHSCALEEEIIREETSLKKAAS